VPSRPDTVQTGATKTQFLLPRFSSVEVTKLTKSNVNAKQTDSIPATRPVGLQKVWKEAIMYKNAWVKHKEKYHEGELVLKLYRHISLLNC